VIALASRGSLLTFSLVTNRFTRNVEEVIKSYRFERYANPLSSRTGLTFIDNSALLLWDKEETNRGIVSYNLDYALSGRQVRGLSSPPVQVTVLEDRLIVLEASGLLKILDRDDFETEFEYQSAGLKKAIAVDDRTVVGAGSRTVLFRSSLIRINSKTGETAPIQDSSLLVYDLAYDPDRDRLYTLSVGSADGSGAVTGVHVRSGRSQSNPETLMHFDGEDLSASIALAGDQLYSSVGYSQVRFWSEGRVQTLQRTRHIPRELTVSGRLLISLNRDSTLTIWDRRSRQVLADLYIFKDYSWIAVFPNENAYISRGADGYLILPQ